MWSRLGCSLLRGSSAKIASLTPSRGYATLKELKIRVENIKTIEKITSSMKMVAVSKLGKVQMATDSARPFFQSISRAIEESRALEKFQSGEQAIGKQLLVPVTSDKGMCGAVNSGVGKSCISQIKEAEFPVEMVVIGDKGRQYFQRLYSDKIRFVASAFGGNKLPSFLELSAIANRLPPSSEKPFDVIRFVFNYWKGGISYEITPRDVPSKALLTNPELFLDYEFEGNKTETLECLWDFYLVSVLFSSCMENSTSELAARMAAMDSASRNAKEMGQLFSRAYNRKRQAAITTEITEIISGAQAQENKED